MSTQHRIINHKSELDTGLQTAVKEMASLLRRHRLSFEQATYCLRVARKNLDILKNKPVQRLPRNLSDQERDAFFGAIEKGGNLQHDLLFRLMYFTGLRVSELTNVRRENVDVPNCSIRVIQGKGSKDRVVLFPDSMQLALRLYLDSIANNEFLFESRVRQRMTTRWLQMLAVKYGDLAGIEKMHPHRLRHTCLTNLTRAGLTDSQIQQVSGHASKKALGVYQSLAVADVVEDYQAAMREHDIGRAK